MNRSENSEVTPFKPMDGEPIFDEPWQAQVLAMADTLISQGVIEPAVWSETLGRELKTAEAAGAPDNIETYYKAALKALEHLLEENGEIPASIVSARRDAWEQAYMATPHGQPVELKV